MTNQQALVLIGILKSVIAELGRVHRLQSRVRCILVSRSDYPLFMEMEQLKDLQESLRREEKKKKKNQQSINSVANFPEKGENG